MAEKIPPQRFGECEIPFTKEDLERKDFLELSEAEIYERYFKPAAEQFWNESYKAMYREGSD